MIKNISIVSLGEIIPEIGDKGRPTRQTILTNFLAQKKYNVKYYSNRFNHFTKKNRRFNGKRKGNIEYILISSIGYQKNVSLRRIIDHILLSFKLFYLLMKNPSDLIVCAFPTLSNVIACHFVSKLKKIKLIIDVRDLWPEIFEKYFKKDLIIKIIIKLNYKLRKIIFQDHKIISISRSYANKIKKSINYKDKIPIFPLGSIDYNDKLKKKKNNKSNNIVFWFLGSMGKTYDLENLINTTNNIHSKNIKFIISGDGASLKNLKKKSTNKNVIFTGWCDLDKISYYGSIADVGLMPYTSFSTQDLPNKIFDYFSFSLPVLTNIRHGDCPKIIKKKLDGFMTQIPKIV